MITAPPLTQPGSRRFSTGVAGLAALLLLLGCAPQVSFQTADGVRVSGALSRPAGSGPFPAVVLLPTGGGIRPQAGEWAQAEGYVVLLVDSFADLESVVRDAFGALSYLRGLPFVDRDRIAAMGFSLGGAAAMRASERASPDGGFRAAIALYPGAPPPSRVWFRSKIPVLLLLGELDLPAGPTFRRIATGLQQENLPVTLVVYPGVHHGFDQAEFVREAMHPGGYTMQYDAGATKDAGGRIRAFLKEHLRRTP